MIVDHPSIMDLIVNRVLANEGDRQKADSIINSFFAGCKKYDLYDLAQIYNTVPLTELQAWQEVINNPQVTQEQFKEAVDNIQPVGGTGPTTGGNQTDATPQKTFDEFVNLGFYFDNNVPGTNPQLTTSTDFQTAYDAYTSVANKQKYIVDNPATSGQTQKFFTSVVEDNYTSLQKLVGELFNLFAQKQAAQVVLKLQGSASPPAEKDYNLKLSARRIDSVTQFLKTYKFDGTNSLGDLVGTKILIAQNAVGEELSNITPIQSDKKSWGSADCTKDTTGKDRTYSTDAMSCRAVILTNVTVIPEQPNPQPNNDAVQQTTLENGQPLEPIKPTPPQVQPTQDLYKGASKKLLRYLLNECDYFEVLKADNPFIYDSIKEKLKYFQPAFHSMTPEGLNSRLTFLQQCARPGETIPTIGPNGEKLYNDALNTSFGAPPVLVLRVGDFFNTKIIPTGINFVYDKTWDMNPEGIGFQPMIVEVNLSFNLVGGMGLKNPIDTLQNALSFNYYANTEMYDERAEATEDTSKLDKQVIQGIINQNPTVGVSNVDNAISNSGGNTIGVFVSTGTTASGQTGTLTYGTFMNNLVTQTQEYYDGTINMFDSVLTNYNYGILSILNYGEKNQAYNTGKFNSTTDLNVSLYGKPQNTQTYVNDSFKQLLEDIDDGNLEIFGSNEFTNPIITAAQKRLFKKNYTNYVQTYRTTFLNSLTTPVNTLSTIQQEYVFNVDRMNFIASGSSFSYDGKLNNKNIAIIYTISGTPEDVNGTTIDSLTSLRNDYISIGNSNNSFLTGLTTSNLYNTNAYQPKTPGTWITPTGLFEYVSNTEYRQREYTLMSRALLQKDLKEGFINALVNGLDQATTNAIKFFYDTSGQSLRVIWEKSNNDGITLLNNYKTSETAKPYIKYTPSFGTTQKRVTVFSEELVPPNSIKQTLQNIYSNKNNNSDKNPYNFKRKFL